MLDATDEAGWAGIPGVVRDGSGRLDWVIASAGVAFGATIPETSLQDWRRVLAVNLDGVFLTLRTALPLIRDGGEGGAVVVLSSVAPVKPEPGIGAYGAAKECAPDRIRVNALLPGGVETPIWHGVPFFRDLLAEHGSERAAFDALGAPATPLGRYATADDATLALVPLCDAPTVTGAAPVADGDYAL